MKKKHLLVVEDSMELRLSIILVLEKSGYKVTDVNNGLDAFNMINDLKNSSEDIDLIITDINIPGINGIELIRKLKKVKISYPTLVMTSFGNTELLIELQRIGCQDYLDKPFTINDLTGSVERALKN